MFRRMDEDMDIDCGVVLDAGVSVAELGERIFERILEVASGDPTKSEKLGFGDAEFVPWQIGAVM
jgi:altronate hydrolase